MAVEREVDWFPKDQTYSERMYIEDPPPSWLTHIYEDSDRRLWTYTIIADANWKPAPPEEVGPEWATRTLDTMIEVIDLDDLEVLAQLRFDELLAPVCGRPFVYTVEEDDMSGTVAVVFNPVLQTPTAPR